MKKGCFLRPSIDNRTQPVYTVYIDIVYICCFMRSRRSGEDQDAMSLEEFADLLGVEVKSKVIQ